MTTVIALRSEILSSVLKYWALFIRTFLQNNLNLIYSRNLLVICKLSSIVCPWFLIEQFEKNSATKSFKTNHDELQIENTVLWKLILLSNTCIKNWFILKQNCGSLLSAKTIYEAKNWLFGLMTNFHNFASK